MGKKKIDVGDCQYSKEQLLSSKKYRKYKDILSSVLYENESYSFDRVDALIDDFMKGKVI